MAFSDCGRDGPFGPPPAQIRTCSITAYGSYRWCLASKRAQGYGCVIAGRGIHRLMSTLNRCQFVVLRIRPTSRPFHRLM